MLKFARNWIGCCYTNPIEVSKNKMRDTLNEAYRIDRLFSGLFIITNYDDRLEGD